MLDGVEPRTSGKSRIATLDESGEGQLLPELEDFTRCVGSRGIVHVAIASTIAGTGRAGRLRIAVASGGVFTPEFGGGEHVAGHRKILVAETIHGGGITRIFGTDRPQFGSANERLAGENAAGEQAENDKYNRKLDKGKSTLLNVIAHTLYYKDRARR